MELLVACALGAVLYFGYLTVKDTLDDLHHEGVLKSLSEWWEQSVRGGSPGGRSCPLARRSEDVFSFLPRRSPLPVTVRHRAEARWYHSHLD